MLLFYKDKKKSSKLKWHLPHGLINTQMSITSMQCCNFIIYVHFNILPEYLAISCRLRLTCCSLLQTVVTNVLPAKHGKQTVIYQLTTGIGMRRHGTLSASPFSTNVIVVVQMIYHQVGEQFNNLIWSELFRLVNSCI